MGIAGGMGAGLPTFVVVNLDDLEQGFSAEEVVTLETLASKRILNCTGADRKLPLKVLGRGILNKPLVVNATAFSTSAKAAIEKAGGKALVVPRKVKWARRAHENKITELSQELRQ